MEHKMKSIINGLKRRLFGMIDRGILTLVNDSLARQQVQIQTLNGEVSSDVERWQNYGHTSVPPKSSEALVLALNANRSNLAVICAEDKKLRLKGLIEGDSALYHLEGHFFKLTKKGVITGVGDDFEIEVKRVKIKATENIVVDSPITTFKGDVLFEKNTETKGTATDAVTVTKDLQADKGVIAGIDMGPHKHQYTDDGAAKVTEVAQ